MIFLNKFFSAMIVLDTLSKSKYWIKCPSWFIENNLRVYFPVSSPCRGSNPEGHYPNPSPNPEGSILIPSLVCLK